MTTQIGTDTELSAVNSILGSIGQSPVTTLGSYFEKTGETTYTGNGSTTAFIHNLTFTDTNQIKATVNGITSPITISGASAVFSVAPPNLSTIVIYSEVEKYNVYENPQVSLIYNILQETNKNVQNEGWHFNTQENQKKSPDANGNFVIPPTYLKFDIHDGLYDRAKDVVKKNGKLFDTIGNTYVFTSDLYFDIVELIDFDDVPSAIQRYIITRASIKAATQLVSNSDLVKLLQLEEAQNRATAVEFDCQMGDHSFFGFPQQTSYRSYQPYKSLIR